MEVFNNNNTTEKKSGKFVSKEIDWQSFQIDNVREKCLENFLFKSGKKSSFMKKVNRIFIDDMLIHYKVCALRHKWLNWNEKSTDQTKIDREKNDHKIKMKNSKFKIQNKKLYISFFFSIEKNNFILL